MWTFTQLGFFSINRTPDGTKLQFRARREQDLVNLKTTFPTEFANEEIMTLPTADYRWRLETGPAAAAIVMCAMTEQIDYRNFKNHLHDTDQTDKLPILHDLWSAMFKYQTDQERPPQVGMGRALAHHRYEADQPWFSGWDSEDREGDGPDIVPDEQTPEMDMRHYVAEAQETGNLITIRELAKKLGLTQGKTIDLCEGEGMNINVAVGTGGGIGRLSPGDYTVEDL